MAQTRTATPVVGTIALVLLGGALATVVGAILMFVGVFRTPFLADFRSSTAYYVLLCIAVGFFTAVGLMLTRPRGPVAPIIALISGLVALYVGNRIGLILHWSTEGGMPGGMLADILKPHFIGWDLVAPLTSGAIASLRVAMVSGSLAPRQPAGAPFPQPGGHGFGQPHQPGPGQPPYAGQPGAGQPPSPGQQPAPSYQPPPVPGPDQGPGPGGAQGAPPPHGGA